MLLGSAPVIPHPGVPLGAARSMHVLLTPKMSTLLAPLPITAIVPGWAASGLSQAPAGGERDREIYNRRQGCGTWASQMGFCRRLQRGQGREEC